MSTVIRPARPRPGLEALEERSVPAGLAALAGGRFASLFAAPTPAAAQQPSLADFTTAGPQSVVYHHTAGGTTTTTTGGSAVAAPTAATSQPQTTAEVNFTAQMVGQPRAAGLQKFNPALGTLTSVEVIAEGGMTADAGVENLGPGAGTVKAELHGSMTFRVAGVPGQVTATLARTEAGTVTAFDGTADLAGTSAKSFNLQAAGSFQTLTLNDAASLALFSGTGTLQVVQQATADACVCGPGNVMAAVETKATGRVRVVYHYTPTAQIGSIAGYVYHDRDKSGAINPGDRMLANVAITLTGTDMYGNAVSRSAVTGANGWFAFGRLTAGTYTLTETQPAGYLQGTNRAGTLGGTVVGDTIAAITVTGGSAGRAYSFGEVTNGTPPPTPITPPPTPITPPPPWTPFSVKSRFGGRFGWL